MARVKKEIGSSSKSNRNRNEGVRELRSRAVQSDSNPGISADSIQNNGDGNNRKRRREEDDNEEEEEVVGRRNRRSRHQPANNSNLGENDGDDNNRRRGREEEQDEVVVRRNLRSRYLAVKNSIFGENEDLPVQDSDRFRTILNEVENLHKQVQKPREQVADAEAFLDITSCLMKSVKSQRNEGATPSDLTSCLVRAFGQANRSANSSVDGPSNLVFWKDVGLAVSHIFNKGVGCSTMLGPMNAEPKIRKCAVRKKHVKPTGMARPEELNNVSEEKTDTDKNMLTMFGILRRDREVRLDKLVLNRISFAQTVENLFALSFLAKDGRAEITANEKGHFVCPRNAPDAKAVESGKVCYDHFVLRFDFKDWKMMLESVPKGEELMPHRVQVYDAEANTSEHGDVTGDVEPETGVVSTPIRKRCRNRGLVLQEQTVVEDSPESDENQSRASYIRRKLA